MFLNIRIHAALFIFTGDHPAQCKAGILKDGGYSSCRRCFIPQELDDQNKLVFKEAFDPDLVSAPPKSIHDLHTGLISWMKALTPEQRSTLSNTSGIQLNFLFHFLYYFQTFQHCEFFIKIILVNSILNS
jgi:hypothetical protein